MAMTNEQLTKWIDEIFGTIDEIKQNSGDISGLTRSVRQLREDLTATQEDVDDLEDQTAGTVSMPKAALQHFTDGSATQALDLIADIIPVQAGTGDPSPTNVRAISGYSSVTAETRGKNWCEGKLTGYSIGSNGTIGGTADYDMCFGKVLQGQTYTITTNDTNGFVGGFFTSEPGTSSTTYNGQRIVTENKTFTAPINGYVAFRTLTGYASAMYELGEEATEYEPYQANTATLSLGSTVYSGTVNFTTGKLTVDKAMVDMGDLTWTKESTSTPDVYRFHAGDLSPVASASETSINGISDIFKGVTINAAWGGSENNTIGVASAAVYVRCDTYSEGTAAEFKTAMTGKQLLYDLATPIETNLTPAQLSLLQGENNVSATSGPITLTYAPDNVLAEVYAYIQKRFDTLTASLAANRTTRKTTKTLTKKED